MVGDYKCSSAMRRSVWVICSNYFIPYILSIEDFVRWVSEISAISIFFSLSTIWSSLRCCRIPLAFHKNMVSGFMLLVDIFNECFYDSGK